jgi:hypothetical protein
VKVLVDSRGKVDLGRIRTRSFDVYEGEELADGTILLRPLSTVPPADLAAMARPSVQQAMERDAGGVASGSAEPVF